MDGSVSNQASKNPETPNKNKEIETWKLWIGVAKSHAMAAEMGISASFDWVPVDSPFRWINHFLGNDG